MFLFYLETEMDLFWDSLSADEREDFLADVDRLSSDNRSSSPGKRPKKIIHLEIFKTCFDCFLTQNKRIFFFFLCDF